MLKINGIDETQLTKRLRKGDQTAFEILFRFYYPGLVIFATQIVFDKDEATEIVQDFFVRLWEKRSHIKESKSFKAYIFTSVKNRSFNYLKKNEVYTRNIEELKELAETSPLYNIDLFIDSKLQEKIKAAVDKLPTRCGEIFVMSRFQGASNDEIAEELDISKRTVETQISNALKVLRVELKEFAGILILLGIIKF